MTKTNTGSTPGKWVPSAFFAEGIPYAVVVAGAPTLLKDLGYSDARITVAIGAVSVAWSIKPLYAGLLDMFGTKHAWAVGLQSACALVFVGLAACLGAEDPFPLVVAVLGVVAVASAAHDIVVDGSYLTTLDDRQKASWSGVRGVSWASGRMFVTAAVVALASVLQSRQGLAAHEAWGLALLASSAVLMALAAYHCRALPRAEAPERPQTLRDAGRIFWSQWVDFFSKPGIGSMLLFVAAYRCGEGLVLMETPLFLQASTADGGLGLCATAGVNLDCPHALSHKALLDGFINGVVAMTSSIGGGLYVARTGLTRKTLLLMAACMNVPNLTLLLLSFLVREGGEPVPLWLIALLVAIEKSGFAFGMVANMLYMMQVISPGRYPMTHYACCTAIMHLVMVPAQVVSGPLADAMGYRGLFALACVATLPSFLVAARAPLPVR